MAGTAEKTDPKLWEKIKKRVTNSNKGGQPGQWSARKAQLATQEYKRAGGGYRGKKTADNHLLQWEKEEWGTKSGKKSLETGERYLPKKARETLSPAEYKRTTERKRADLRKGKQFSEAAQGRGSQDRLGPQDRRVTGQRRPDQGGADGESARSQHRRAVEDEQGGARAGAGLRPWGKYSETVDQLNPPPIKEKGGRSRPALCPGPDRSALRELEARAGLLAAVLLALDDARVAGQEAFLLQRRPQSARNWSAPWQSLAHRARLARSPHPRPSRRCRTARRDPRPRAAAAAPCAAPGRANRCRPGGR
jgi:hypothetical protein